MVNVSVIKRFEVSELFGLHDYKLEFGASAAGETLHETLLYGDNGTGKTTILKLMYHVLSKKAGEGSRSYLSRTPFKRLYLELAAGQTIEMVKDQEQRLIFNDGATATTIVINPDPEDGAVRGQSNPDLVHYERFLSALKIQQLYLSDDRVILTSYPRFAQRRQSEREAYMASRRSPAPALNTVDLNALGLRVRDIIRDKLIDSSVYGQSNVRNIYLDLAKRLALPYERDLPHRSQTVSDIQKRVTVIASDYNTASSLEIFPRVDFEEFVAVARESGAAQQASAIAVIETYLDTIEAQVTAVKGLATLLNDLVEEVNSYFVNKRLTFSIRDGFKVLSGGSQLKFADLSSGERQLLFLMLISFVIRDDKSIVFIDEPELSLNIKWQRRLISSMLKMITGTETQLIAATHSFEILAKHRDAIVDLNGMPQDER